MRTCITPLLIILALLLLSCPQAAASDENGSLESVASADAHRRLLGRAWDRYNAGETQRAVELFRLAAQAPDQEVANEAKLGLGYSLNRLGDTQGAEALFREMADADYRLDDTLPMLLELLLARGDLEQARELLPRLDPAAREEWEQRIAALTPADKPGNQPEAAATSRPPSRLEVLGQRLANLDSASAEWRAAAQEYLKLRPKDAGVRAGLAWSCHNAGEHDCAQEQFTILIQEADSPDPNHINGLAYSYVAQGKADEALALLETHETRLDDQGRAILAGLLRDQGLQAYEAGDHARAVALLERAMDLSADDGLDTDTAGLLAWARLKSGDAPGALELFRRIFEADPGPDTAQGVLAALDETNNQAAMESFLSRLEQDLDPALRKLAAERFHARGQTLRAAKTWDGPDECWSGCDSPSVEVSVYHRYKDGDAGTSRLHETGIPVTGRMPLDKSKELIVRVTPMLLSAGQAEDKPYVGRFYRVIQDPGVEDHSLMEQTWVVEPWVGLRWESPIRLETWLGLTPMGGLVGPMPTFLARAEETGVWRFELHQCPVRQSLLSLVGQRDPYSGDYWGRVLQTGVSAGLGIDLPDPWWFSLDAGFDYYWGWNVLDNWSVWSTASAGRTDNLGPVDLTLGAYFDIRRFERDLDHHTYGHGGYFSPQLFLAMGPLARLTSAGCNLYAFDIEASLGWFWYRTDDSDRYLLTGDDPLAFAPGAQDELLRSYDGDVKSGISGRLRGQGMILLSEHIALGVFAGLDAAPDYWEASGGLSFRFFLDPRENLCPGDAATRGPGPCR